MLNAPPGFAAGLLLGLPWEGALALGGVTWISSSGIVARLLGDLGRLANRETPAVLSVLVLEDLAMALFLPLLVVALADSGPMAAVAGVALAVGAVLLVLLAAQRHGHRLGRLLTHDDDEQVLLRLVGLTLLVAGLAQSVGASAAVGRVPRRARAARVVRRSGARDPQPAARPVRRHRSSSRSA